jgi:hypothetical protein
MMRQILEYGAWTGAAWLLSNVAFVFGWSWLHAQKRSWMHDEDQKVTIFGVPDGNDPGPDGTGLQPFPHYLFNSLEQNEMTMDKAS